MVDFLHTVALFLIIYYFVFTTYGTSDLIGSPSKMYDLLKEAALRTPVEGNAGGSYLTMKSNSGMLFAASTIATGFSVSSCPLIAHLDYLLKIRMTSRVSSSIKVSFSSESFGSVRAVLPSQRSTTNFGIALTADY